MKVVEFTPPPKPVPAEVQTNADTIAILTRLLDEAKAGMVREVAIAVILEDGRSRHHTSSTRNIQALIGASTILTDRLLRSMVTVNV